jgi:hypothetical protein
LFAQRRKARKGKQRLEYVPNKQNMSCVRNKARAFNLPKKDIRNHYALCFFFAGFAALRENFFIPVYPD